MGKEDENGEVKRISVKQASRFLKTMENLDDDEWKAILDGAKAFATLKENSSRHASAPATPVA